jgi:hypothetical protein
VLKGGEADIRNDIFSLGVILFRLSRKYYRIARKCCEMRPSARYASAAEVKKAVHSNSSLYAGLAFILLVALMALLPYLGGKREKEADTPVVTADSTRAVNVPVDDTQLADTVSVTNIPTTPKVKNPVPQGKAAESGETVDASVIDELFRQATELFD